MKIANAKTFGNQFYMTDADIESIMSSHVASAIHVPSNGTSGYYLKTNGGNSVEWATVAQNLQELDNAAYTKLGTIETSAQVNQNAVRTIAVKATAATTTPTNVSATTQTDTITFIGGDNVTLTGNATNKTVTISAKDTTYATATTAKDGLMGSAMVTKLNGVATGAEVNQLAIKTLATKEKSDSTAVNVAATTKTDTVTVIGGDNVTVVGNASNKTVTINAVDTTYEDATATKTGLMTSTMVTKLEGVATGAEVNQLAVKTIAVKSSVGATAVNVAATTKTDTVTFIGGDNVTLSGNASNKTVTISAKDTTYSVATTTANGLMSSTMVTKLNGIATGAEVNQNAVQTLAVKPNATATATSLTATEKTDTITVIGGDNITLSPDATNKTLTISAKDTTYATATTAKDGLMGSAMVTKLNGIATGAQANQNAVQTIAVKATAGATTSTNVTATTATDKITLVGGDNVTLAGDATNKVITISAKDTTYATATTTKDGLMGSAMVTKLNGIATGATNVTTTTVAGWGYTKITSADVSSIAGAVFDEKSTTVFKYVSSVNAYSNLPTTGQKVGDVYNVATADATHNIKAGENVAWNGSAWDPLGGTVDLSNYPTTATVSSMITSAATKIDSSITQNGANPVTGSAIYSALGTKVDKVNGKGLSTEDFTTAFKTKLTNIASGAEVNQNAINTLAVKQGTTTTNVVANAKEATVTLIGGTNVTLTPDATNRTVTISAKDTTYATATTTADGLMGSAMVSKLNGVAVGAEVNQLAIKTIAVKSNATATAVNVAATGKTDTVTFIGGDNVILSGNASNKTVVISAKDTTYATATTTKDGLMGSAMVTKLNGVTAGAEPNQNAINTLAVKSTAAATAVNVTADSTEATVTIVGGTNVTVNPDATNKTLTISAKDTTYDVVTTTKNGLMGSAMLTKLNGIATGATNVTTTTVAGWGYTKITSADVSTIASNIANATFVVDGAVASDGANPVTGSAIYSELSTKVDKEEGKGLSTKDFTAAYETKLNGIATGAEKNQLAVKTIAVKSTATATAVNVAATTTTDTMTFIGGDNVTLSGNATNKTIVISAKDTTYATATTAKDGLMGSAMVTKLNGMTDGAEPNQLAVKTIAVKSNANATAVNVEATTTTDTVTFVGGDNVILSGNATNKTVVISAKDTTYATATTTKDGLMGSAMVTKLNGVATGAEVNQNAIQKVAVKATTAATTTTTITAGTKTDTVTFIGGDNVTLAGNATNKTVTISAKDTTYSVATTTANGLMDSTMVTKLNGISANAEVNQNAYQTVAVKQGTTTTNVAATGKTDTLTLVAGDNVTLAPNATNRTVTISAKDTTYSVATTTKDGLMGSAMVTKLNGIATGAEVNQNAFKTITVSNGGTATNVVADAKEDTLTLVAGANITLTPDATNDKITISATVPTVGASVTSNGTTAVTGSAIYTHVENKVADRVKYEDIAQVGFTGDYNDLVNTPTIPTGSALLPPSQKIQFTSANGTNATWSGNDLTITHTVDCIPNVIVYDNDWELTYPTVRYLTNSTVKILFEDKSIVTGTWTCIIVYGFRG